MLLLGKINVKNSKVSPALIMLKHHTLIQTFDEQQTHHNLYMRANEKTQYADYAFNSSFISWK